MMARRLGHHVAAASAQAALRLNAAQPGGGGTEFRQKLRLAAAPEVIVRR